MLDESTAYVSLSEEDLSAKDAFIATFIAMDCFSFLTKVLCFGAMNMG